MEIRNFSNEDAEKVSNLIRRNFLEVNIKDYSIEEMQERANMFDTQKVLEVAGYAHMYVVCADNHIIGCGAIASFWGKPDESILLTIFVLPELQGQGIGRAIIQKLEEDELFINAKRIEIPASITACEFYRKLGYDYKDGINQLDEERLIRLEKFR